MEMDNQRSKDAVLVVQSGLDEYVEPGNRWEEIKPHFMRLYIEEGRSLDRVRQELKKRYNFNASKSAFTRQIKIWRAFKNLKASEAQQLVARRKSGQRPEYDSQGRPVPWDRAFRSTRSRTAAQGLRSENSQHALIVATRPQIPPVDYDKRVIYFVSNIWRRSTRHFASQNPSTAQYHAQYLKYSRLIDSMDLISMSSDDLWPQDAAETLCKEMYNLVKQQPAMACEIFIFLIKRDPAESSESVKKLKDHLFEYFRALSKARLPKCDPLRQLLATLDDRTDYTRLGGAVAKAKLDAMWKTSINEIGQKHHQRKFFRKVLMQAVLVISEYGDSKYAAEFLPELSKPYERLAIEPAIYDTPAETSQSEVNTPEEAVSRPPEHRSP